VQGITTFMIKHSVLFNRASDHNEAYDNSLANYKIGIYLCNTTNNKIYNNSIQGSEYDRMAKENITENIVNDIILLNTTKDFFSYSCMSNSKAI